MELQPKKLKVRVRMSKDTINVYHIVMLGILCITFLGTISQCESSPTLYYDCTNLSSSEEEDKLKATLACVEIGWNQYRSDCLRQVRQSFCKPTTEKPRKK